MESFHRKGLLSIGKKNQIKAIHGRRPPRWRKYKFQSTDVLKVLAIGSCKIKIRKKKSTCCRSACGNVFWINKHTQMQSLWVVYKEASRFEQIILLPRFEVWRSERPAAGIHLVIPPYKPVTYCHSSRTVSYQTLTAMHGHTGVWSYEVVLYTVVLLIRCSVLCSQMWKQNVVWCLPTIFKNYRVRTKKLLFISNSPLPFSQGQTQQELSSFNPSH